VFRELFGLPAHALIVHAAVVFIPLAAVAAILYAVWPGVRKNLWWAVLGLGILAPVTGWAARLSGQEYETWWLANGAGGTFVDEINQHQALGNVLSWWATGLGVVMLAMVLYVFPVKAPASGGPSSSVVRVVSAVVTVAVAGVTLYYVIRTGDAGAHLSHNEI
jgi:hypothetical protein